MKCTRCSGYVDDSEINTRTGKTYFSCKECRDKRSFRLNPDRREKMRSYYANIDKYRNRREEIRKRFFQMYGSVCICCNESLAAFLTLDHINGDGYKERLALGGTDAVYRIAVKEYRPDLYQVLCYNCNCGKGKNSQCPHKTQLTTTT